MHWRVFRFTLSWSFYCKFEKGIKNNFFHIVKFNVLQSSIEYLKIYTYEQLYKPGKVITSVAKKGERNITFVTIISANAFKSNKFVPFKKSKKK